MHRRTTLRRRRRREGMSLIEIMVVLLIIGLITTAVTVAVIPKFQEAKIHTAKTESVKIRAAVTGYLMSGYDDCPTAEDLIEARELDSTADGNDPWDNAYDIECDGDDVIVASAGPDQQLGTDDDITTARQ